MAYLCRTNNSSDCCALWRQVHSSRLSGRVCMGKIACPYMCCVSFFLFFHFRETKRCVQHFITRLSLFPCFIFNNGLLCCTVGARVMLGQCAPSTDRWRIHDRRPFHYVSPFCCFLLVDWMIWEPLKPTLSWTVWQRPGRAAVLWHIIRLAYPTRRWDNKCWDYFNTKER